jgi:hypothetical protein
VAVTAFVKDPAASRGDNLIQVRTRDESRRQADENEQAVGGKVWRGRADTRLMP